MNHQFTVISTDFVPVNAYTTSSLLLGIGQRYDVTIDASQAVGNYWFNVTLPPNGFCGTSVVAKPAAIFHYAGASGGLPTIQGTPPADSLCYDNLDFSPVVTRTASPGNFSPNPSNTLPVHLDLTGSPLFVWKVNGSAINVDWNKPALQYILDGNTSYPANANVISVAANNQVSRNRATARLGMKKHMELTMSLSVGLLAHRERSRRRRRPPGMLFLSRSFCSQQHSIFNRYTDIQSASIPSSRESHHCLSWPSHYPLPRSPCNPISVTNNALCCRDTTSWSSAARQLFLLPSRRRLSNSIPRPTLAVSKGQTQSAEMSPCFPRRVGYLSLSRQTTPVPGCCTVTL